MKAEKVRNTMETAHDAEMEMIDVKSEEAKVAAEKMHAAKMRAFYRARRGVSHEAERSGNDGERSRGNRFEGSD